MSLMGIFGADINVPGPFPVVLPKLCLGLWVVSDVSDPPKHIKIRVLIPPNKEEAIVWEQEISPQAIAIDKKDATRIQLFTNIIIQNISIPSSGYIEVFVDSGHGDSRASRLLVRATEAPTTKSDQDS